MTQNEKNQCLQITSEILREMRQKTLKGRALEKMKALEDVVTILECEPVEIPATAAPTQADLIPPPQGDLFAPPSPSMPVRQLPTTRRLREQDPHIYATALVAAILHEAQGPLRWQQLRRAYIFATAPAIMLAHALTEDQERVKAWQKSWDQPAGPEHLLQAIRNLGGKTLAASKTPDGEPIFALQDGSVRNVEAHVGYDAWLALRIAAGVRYWMHCPEVPKDNQQKHCTQ